MGFRKILRIKPTVVCKSYDGAKTASVDEVHAVLNLTQLKETCPALRDFRVARESFMAECVLPNTYAELWRGEPLHMAHHSGADTPDHMQCVKFGNDSYKHTNEHPPPNDARNRRHEHQRN